MTRRHSKIHSRAAVTHHAAALLQEELLQRLLPLSTMVATSGSVSDVPRTGGKPAGRDKTAGGRRLTRPGPAYCWHVDARDHGLVALYVAPPHMVQGKEAAARRLRSLPSCTDRAGAAASVSVAKIGRAHV